MLLQDYLKLKAKFVYNFFYTQPLWVAEQPGYLLHLKTFFPKTLILVFEVSDFPKIALFRKFSNSASIMRGVNGENR